MKITNNYISNIINKTNKLDKNESKTFGVSKTKMYDKITIDKPSKLSDEEFIANLKSKLTNDIKMSSANEKVSNIKDSIKKGEYNIATDEIVRKLTLGL